MSEKNEIKTYDFSEPASLINMAETLKVHIVKQNLFTQIQGKNYVNVEGWQFAGGLVGVYPMLESVEPMHNDTETFTVKGQEKKVYKYKAWVKLMHKGQPVGQGFAMCTNTERGKEYFDEYAVASMAQTRATGKAFRLLLGWVMKSANYEATPAEEMQYTDVHVEETSSNVDETIALEWQDKLVGTESLAELTKIWASIPAEYKESLLKVKDELKKTYENQ